MNLRLNKLWEWSEEHFGLIAAEPAGDVLVGLSWDDGVIAFRPQPDRPQVLWRHRPVAGGRVGLLAASVRPPHVGSLQSVILALREGDRGPVLRCLRVADGSVAWEQWLDWAVVDAMAADSRFVYVRHAYDVDRRIIAFDADTGGEVATLHVPERVKSMVAAGDGDGRVLFATGRTVSEWDVRETRERVLVELPESARHPRDVYGLIPVGPRVFAADEHDVLLAIDRSTSPARMAWRTKCPGGVSVPVYDERLDLLVTCDSDGKVSCLNGFDGSVRWTARCRDASSSILAGAPAFLHTRFGPLVAFPGMDEALYLADAETGEVLDRFQFGWPLEVQVRALADRQTVIVPFGTLSAFDVVRE